MNRFPNSSIMIFALVIGTLPGCSRSEKADPKAEDAAAFATPTELTATLADPINIDLKWKDNAVREAGYLVEYSPNADNEFVTIAAVPPNTTTYRHPNLVPETRFIFRVLPFFGEASNVAEITTGKKGPQHQPSKKMLNNKDKANAAGSGAAESAVSIRSAANLAQAAPTELTATLVPPAGVKLEWKNHAKDEDGYLLEIKSDPSTDFKVSDFMDPGTHSLITYNLPYETKVFFRVRAFFYGKPSNLAEQTTGRDPTDQTLKPAAPKGP